MASVTFKRTNNIDSVPIVDGQLIFDTSDQKIYLDNGNTREVYGGGSGTDLISNVSDATDNNAFNANATVNLFTRKSSIVDTKAEIQSVTQAGVPLGCKGFNEVIGTGDISALGDGSVTGAILANKSAIDTVNQNLTKNVRWNSEDDYLYGYKDGQWQKGVLKLGLNKQYVFVNGEWQIAHSENTPNFTYYPNEGTFSVVGNKIVVSAPTPAKSRAVQFAIENNGNPIVFKYTLNGVDNTVSIPSDYTTTYVCIWSYTDSGGAPQVGYIGFYESQQTSASWPNQMSGVKRSDVINWQISEIYADI